MDKHPRNEESRPAPMVLNRQVTVFLVCLLIAIVFWLLQSLSDVYPATIGFPVRYSGLPERKVVVNELPARIALDLRTTGFRILYYRFFKSPDPVEIDVSSGIASTGVSSDVLVVPTRYFLQDFNSQLGEEIQVTGFRPDSIVLMFNDRVSKRVPVLTRTAFSLRRQYDTLAGPTAFPDSVTVSGPPSAVRNIARVYTHPADFGELQSSVDTPVVLQPVPLVDIEPSEVRVSIKVEKFTEGIFEVDVHPVNVPAGFVLKTFPDQVKVRYQASLSVFSTVDKEQFEVVADASSANGSGLNMLPLRVVTQPAGVRSVVVEPLEVEFLLRRK
ncbi:MAG: hypothetical protein RL213_2102 [Bacteroidota bacterium]|jgi:YbbR domain-containing protein